jgi:serine/threonine protein kinase
MSIEENTVKWELTAGNVVDGWTLIEYLGGGGNGEVWDAEHQTFGKAALKLLKLHLQAQDEKRYRRFRDEAKMHQQLAERHPGVLPFIASSLPENPTREAPAWLATQVSTRARDALEGKPLRDAVEAVAAVAETLAVLHNQGVSHRDIKPDNLFRCEDRWVVGDFGLVDFPDKDSLTDKSERLGPYHYLAPDMQQEANQADSMKADVYSLGKTLWVMATEQHHPLAGELRADNPQLGVGTFRPHPDARKLDLLIERSTRNNPEDRPPMADFAAEMWAWLAIPREQQHPDLSDLLAPVRASAGPSLRAPQERLRQGQEAEDLSRHLSDLMAPIVQAFVKTGMAGNGVEELESADTVFWRQRTMDMPTALWQRGIAVTVHKPGTPISWSTSHKTSAPIAWSAEGIDSVQLTCAVWLEVRVDGTIRLFGGYAIQSIYSPEFIAFKEDVAPLGSSLQEKAVADLFAELIEALPRALARFIQWVDAGGQHPGESLVRG